MLKRLFGETKQDQRQKAKKAKPIGYWFVSIKTCQQSIQLKSSRDLFPFKQTTLELLFCNQQ